MTLQERLGNRYMVSFIDHKSNYCRVFLARTKDAAAKQFEAFLIHFERLFGFKVHVLRTTEEASLQTLTYNASARVSHAKCRKLATRHRTAKRRGCTARC